MGHTRHDYIVKTALLLVHTPSGAVSVKPIQSHPGQPALVAPELMTLNQIKVIKQLGS